MIAQAEKKGLSFTEVYLILAGYMVLDPLTGEYKIKKEDNGQEYSK